MGEPCTRAAYGQGEIVSGSRRRKKSTSQEKEQDGEGAWIQVNRG